MTQQPAHVPLIASGVLNSTYTAPGEPWDGAPCVIQLDPAEEAAGFEPDAPLDANVANGLLYPIGEAIRSLLPVYVDNWPTRVTLASFNVPSVLGTPPRGKLVQSIPGTTQLILRTLSGVGGAAGPFKYSTSHPELDAVADWTEAAGSGISDW